MPRRQRDYRAEYQRRKQLEQERSARENRPFSMHRARGHKSREYEAAQRRRLRPLRRPEPTVEDILTPGATAWYTQDDVEQAIQRMGREETEALIEFNQHMRDYMMAGERGQASDVRDYLMDTWVIPFDLSDRWGWYG